MFRRTPQVSRAIAATVVALGFLGFAPIAVAQDVHGAGSTFVTPILVKWADDYEKTSGIKIAYDSVGSGAGIKKIEAGEVDFGATDKPLDPAELAKYGLCQFPIVIGAVVPVVNLPGVTPGELKFSGQLLADIYLHKVTRWDDPEIQALNRGVKLPALPIAVVHRADGSGTTYNWTDFLAKASPEWKAKYGASLAPDWPTGTGGQGNAGVAAAVLQSPGAVGYVEYAYALQNKMIFGQVQNSYRLFVIPSPDTFQSAAEGMNWSYYPDFSGLLTNGGGPTSYPVTATTFILMDKTPKDARRSAAALKFFEWALDNGDKQAADLHYVALPPKLIMLIEAYWASHIKGPGVRSPS